METNKATQWTETVKQCLPPRLLRKVFLIGNDIWLKPRQCCSPFKVELNKNGWSYSTLQVLHVDSTFAINRGDGKTRWNLVTVGISDANNLLHPIRLLTPTSQQQRTGPYSGRTCRLRVCSRATLSPTTLCRMVVWSSRRRWPARSAQRPHTLCAGFTCCRLANARPAAWAFVTSPRLRGRSAISMIQSRWRSSTRNGRG